jgi:hypothetical protein
MVTPVTFQRNNAIRTVRTAKVDVSPIPLPIGVTETLIFGQVSCGPSGMQTVNVTCVGK